jgi:hypothetical protein
MDTEKIKALTLMIKYPRSHSTLNDNQIEHMLTAFNKSPGRVMTKYAITSPMQIKIEQNVKGQRKTAAVAMEKLLTMADFKIAYAGRDFYNTGTQTYYTP